ncbi:MAG: branched-chain amino acid ABC transporter ATP-binding protein/permease [Synergistaceae bacterium]|jgi:branched-chain amino acid transport system permease protein|nr:branched-chain amino acid ABC transporter ATP-binding protein/permease [Synergistaceae bacterium]
MRDSLQGSNVWERAETFLARRGAALMLLLVLLCLALPLVPMPSYIKRIFVLIMIYGTLALGLNLPTGYTGQVSLGNSAFFAIGAYTSALLVTKAGFGFFSALPFAALLAGFFGLLVGLPSLRLSGSYLSIVTLGFAEIVRMVLTNWHSVTNGPMGVKNIPRPFLWGLELSLRNNGAYYLIFAILFFTTLLSYLVVRSKIGRAFVSIKEDELAATMMGVKTVYYKVLAFVLSAGISGVAGAFYAHFMRYIDPNSFTFDTSILILSIVILGGMGTLRGMYLGAILLVSFPEVLRFLEQYRFVFYGLVLVLMMRFRPQGALGWQSKVPYRFPGGVNPETISENLESVSSHSSAGGDTPLIDVRGVVKRFGGLVAVGDVSFHVNRGEIVSIIGPNGAGKTTIFNILTGVYEIDAGDILFDSRAIHNATPEKIVKAGVSRTFQNIRLFPNMRVVENVLVGMHVNTCYGFFDAVFRTARFRSEERLKAEKAVKILKSIGLDYRTHDYAKNLPYGEQRKLEIARAIATDARLILLDEPAAGMNPQESEKLLDFIRLLREKGYTILLIEHDMNVVMNISDRIYVLDYGKLIAHGRPDDIANNPEVIQAYLGGVRENAEREGA